MSFDSTAAARSVCALLRVYAVGCISLEIFVIALVLADGGAVSVLVCDHVLRAGALAITVGMNAARLRLRCLIFFVA